jgi:ATP-dependent Lhr-like helicase
MALSLQERGIGRSEWFGWVDAVPAFGRMDEQSRTALVESMIVSQILWSDRGILSFAPEGEAKYGRKNFMELLSVFTSPPLFRVLFGRKELGFVHESTFFNREDGPAVLLLAGRPWRTTHLDWRRRVAHVEPTDQKGKSRWLGQGQFLRFEVCRSIRDILASDRMEPSWSRRAGSRIAELREEFPWVRNDSTALVLGSKGEVRWWTFAGGVANTLLGQHLKRYGEPEADNVSIRFEGGPPIEMLHDDLRSLTSDQIEPVPDARVIENLKFSEALPRALADEVFCSRFNDEEAIRLVLAEPMRVITGG